MVERNVRLLPGGVARESPTGQCSIWTELQETHCIMVTEEQTETAFIHLIHFWVPTISLNCLAIKTLNCLRHNPCVQRTCRIRRDRTTKRGWETHMYLKEYK